ncbi:peptidoglycan recognition family protein [Cohnella luojiensis]|uniref:N-acetylmuramoyl-L-alanine amidase n=1 Tax=Cohnella luojiensis TaxID=652876 RepID=A0A4Y8M3V7_9BACL|nr:peptidoglycan recognition family protein [Cohnella luojiensis]TFE27519.1 N-acetylmuramoyl-L-alanine amidase [Cohnella luojiensis]
MGGKRKFRRYTLQEFLVVLDQSVKKVRFNGIHVHATWRPTIQDYREAKDKESLIQAMWRFHTGTRKFTDIAQHVTIDPDGYIWEGRSLLTSPASTYDHNDSDNDGVHPFMFEMIGNFDRGAEVLTGAQLETTLGLCRGIMTRWKLGLPDIRFHREMQSGKTCPGSGIDKAKFLAQLAKPKPTTLTVEQVNSIINEYLKPAWSDAKSQEQKDEIHRLANELRKAAGIRIE